MNGLIGNTGSSAQSPIALQELVNPELVYIFCVADHFRQQHNRTITIFRRQRGDNGQGKVLSNKKISKLAQFTERLAVR
ncbi:MAG: hypothetical protein IPN86_24135 [Saprospiraceae bacterium]|nr:hypothetical protein [Saprospiraceae bacterium]